MTRRRFVPGSVITARMDAKDARFARALQRRQGPRPIRFLESEYFPCVDVEIIRAPDAVGPVIDVTLEPKIDGAK